MKSILAFLLFCFVSSFAAEIGTPVLPTFQDKKPTVQRSTISQEQLYLEESVDSTYRVGAGDFFEILTPKGLDVVQVSPEGGISIPECGMVSVNDLPLSEAKLKILELLAVKYEKKYVGVQIVRLKHLQVSALGAILTPGHKTFPPQTRLSAAIGTFGGFLSSSDKRHIKLYRRGDSLEIDFTKFEFLGDEKSNPILENGDAFFIPHSLAENSVLLYSQEFSFTMPCIPNKMLSEYIVQAGISSKLNFKWARIKRPDGTVQNYELMKARDFVLAPKTEVELWEREPVVYVGGAVSKVGVEQYNHSFHAIDYIASAGVLIITGDWSRVSVIRDGKSFSINPYHDEILPGDYIEIPRSFYESIKDVTLFLASLLSVIATAIIISTY